MLQTVEVGKRSISAYRGVAPTRILDHVLELAHAIRGVRVLHINATPYGGGVSELLRSTVPLLNDLGIVADWKIIGGDIPFFQVTKRIHNGLQGASIELVPEEREIYESNAKRNAELMEEEYDFVFVHDPQPAGILQYKGKGGARWVWRCHIDTSQPNPDVWAFIRPFLDLYDAAVFTMPEFVPPGLPVERVDIIPPAIDPLSPKNMALPESLSRQILDWIGVDVDRPLVTQVSRFDPWKDPLGVVAAYRMVREQVPTLQLALVGSMALDDPEGWEVYRQLTDVRQHDPQIHVFTNLTGAGNIEVNAFQRLSDLVVQKSIREGFGLVVSETLWKGTPVVAGNVGGIPLQMADGVGGLLATTVEECAQAMLELLSHPDEASELARSGTRRIAQHFLLPRLLADELTLIGNLAAGRRARPTRKAALPHDPVCGMALVSDRKLTTTFRGREVSFCSRFCLDRFELNPEHYMQVPARGAAARG